MGNQPATMTITLNVPDDFTGRVLVYLDKGKVKSQCRLRNNEIVSTVSALSTMNVALRASISRGRSNQSRSMLSLKGWRWLA
ncbi:TPA: hypothetical protein ACP7TM_002947 [Escherichia coli]